MKDGICTAICVVGSTIASFFGGFDAALITLLIFMGVDYATGLIVAGVFHSLKRRRTAHWRAVQAGRDFAEKEFLCSLFLLPAGLI